MHKNKFSKQKILLVVRNQTFLLRRLIKKLWKKSVRIQVSVTNWNHEAWGLKSCSLSWLMKNRRAWEKLKKIKGHSFSPNEDVVHQAWAWSNCFQPAWRWLKRARESCWQIAMLKVKNYQLTGEITRRNSYKQFRYKLSFTVFEATFSTSVNIIEAAFILAVY